MTTNFFPVINNTIGGPNKFHYTNVSTTYITFKCMWFSITYRSQRNWVKNKLDQQPVQTYSCFFEWFRVKMELWFIKKLRVNILSYILKFNVIYLEHSVTFKSVTLKWTIYQEINILSRFICLKRLQENGEYCPDFEVRYCCRHDYLLTNQTIDKNRRVKREPIEMSLIDIEDITRNVHADLD